MVTMGFVVKDRFNRRLVGGLGVSVLPRRSKQFRRTGTLRSLYRVGVRNGERDVVTKITDHFEPSGMDGAGRNAKTSQKLGQEVGEDKLTNIAIRMAALGKVSLSLLQDFSQSSRVTNVSVRTLRVLEPVSSTVKANLLRSNSALTLIALALHSCLLTVQSSSFVRKRL